MTSIQYRTAWPVESNITVYSIASSCALVLPVNQSRLCSRAYSATLTPFSISESTGGMAGVSFSSSGRPSASTR